MNPSLTAGSPRFVSETLFLPRVLFPVELPNILKFSNNQLYVYLYISQEDS